MVGLRGRKERVGTQPARQGAKPRSGRWHPPQRQRDNPRPTGRVGRSNGLSCLPWGWPGARLWASPPWPAAWRSGSRASSTPATLSRAPRLPSPCASKPDRSGPPALEAAWAGPGGSWWVGEAMGHADIAAACALRQIAGSLGPNKARCRRRPCRGRGGATRSSGDRSALPRPFGLDQASLASRAARSRAKSSPAW